MFCSRLLTFRISCETGRADVGRGGGGGACRAVDVLGAVVFCFVLNRTLVRACVLFTGRARTGTRRVKKVKNALTNINK